MASQGRRTSGALLALAVVLAALIAPPAPCADAAIGAPGPTSSCPLMKMKAMSAHGGESGCPMPSEAMSCCGGGPAPPANVDRTAVAPELAPAMSPPATASSAPAPFAAPARSPLGPSPRAAEPVPLYTLHATLLI